MKLRSDKYLNFGKQKCLLKFLVTLLQPQFCRFSCYIDTFDPVPSFYNSKRPYIMMQDSLLYPSVKTEWGSDPWLNYKWQKSAKFYEFLWSKFLSLLRLTLSVQLKVKFSWQTAKCLNLYVRFSPMPPRPLRPLYSYLS